MNARADIDWRVTTRELRAFVARRVAPEDVDDVAQDILLKVHERLGGNHGPERFGPWLHRVALNAIADHHRARSGRRRRHERAADEAAAQGPTPAATPVEDPMDAAEVLAVCMEPFVSLLPAPYRDALTLVELQGLTHREAAERAGISVSGMKSRVQRGRAMLRANVEACCAVDLDARNHVTEMTPRLDPDCCGK